MNKGTFPDEEKKEWVEKCPKCNEEFNRSRGGPQCQSGKCSDLDLQNKHEEVLPLMVECALPQYKDHINVNVPKDWHAFGAGMYDGNMGLSDAFATPPSLKIPWYTCRIKGTFFDTTCHECGHISVIHAKTEKGTVWFNSSSRRKIKKWMPWAIKWYEEQWKFKKNQKIKEKMKKIENNPKYQSSINYFKKEQDKSEGGHEKTTWQNEYVRIHGTLMGSQFAWYNYKKTQPKDYPSSILWKDF